MEEKMTRQKKWRLKLLETGKRVQFYLTQKELEEIGLDSTIANKQLKKILLTNNKKKGSKNG